MARQAPSLARISRERILAELTLLLLGEYVDHGLDALRRTGLLQVALPEIEPLARRGRGEPRADGSAARKISGTTRSASCVRPHPVPLCAGRLSCMTRANR